MCLGIYLMGSKWDNSWASWSFIRIYWVWVGMWCVQQFLKAMECQPVVRQLLHRSGPAHGRRFGEQGDWWTSSGRLSCDWGEVRPVRLSWCALPQCSAQAWVSRCVEKTPKVCRICWCQGSCPTTYPKGSVGRFGIFQLISRPWGYCGYLGIIIGTRIARDSNCSCHCYLGGSINGGAPVAEWFIMENHGKPY